MEDKQIEKVKKLFEHISIETFVKFFYVFQKNKGIRNNSKILEAFEANKEPWSKSSASTRASKIKKTIFEGDLEITAIRYITEYANENKVSEEAMSKANEIKKKLYQFKIT